ncbi:REP-associated tyrosine transposase [Polaromonas hydrogenivorans]|uniref:Transposase n=1 Tax=Polaromonas hydrogenivorans TaxID=335476 RepID=A0AAU7LUG4_9BURK
MNAGNAEPQLGCLGDSAELGLGVPGVPGVSTPGLKGWYSRGYLPHCDASQILQSITFRLTDALPQDKLRQLTQEIALLPLSSQGVEQRRKIEEWMDAGMGCCALRHPRVAAVMQDTLQKFDGERYRLIAWCIMPNHVHVLIEPTTSLPKIVQSWKSYTGRWALLHNAELGLGVPGHAFWMRDYWDRYIRHERHLQSVIHYIHENPVKAGLCQTAQDWPFSSAKLQA